MPISRLDNGPTIEIIISDLGVFGSSPILETPPNRYNSISSTLSPYFCATIEWLNSWINIERSKINPLTKPTIIKSIKGALGMIDR